MKPFGQWVMETQTYIEEDEVELVSVHCCVCGKDIDVIAEFGIDPKNVTEDDEFYCGCSPRCYP